MTIGPAPMMRIDLRSLRFGIAHHLGEAIEQITDVVRSRARFRMALEAERGAISAREPLEGTVEERDMRRPQVPFDGRGIDGKTVVLAGDHYLAAVQVLHRVVRAVVTELHLHGLRAGSEA